MRLATVTDVPSIGTLMRVSTEQLFPLFYTEDQAASAVIHLTEPDVALIEDGTYYVHEADGEVVACGGWSRRNKLYTGSGAQADDGRMLDPRTEPARVRAMFVRHDWTRRGLAKTILDACVRAARDEGFRSLTLMATLPGVPLYRAFGFSETRQTMLPLPDGVRLEGVEMTLSLLS
nr:GNAT family N-acetyltransferase [Kibdelosporangium sp. MJ126-NF4]CEL20197.1 acetyltransferase, GNAT family [Kibdelosporangium sp. MJ126-NF4]CTQ97422.1 acetyltransferase, GNAT family [Kibdelosporangium sp. MJ126-NF4]